MNDELEQFESALSEQGAELSEAGKQRREAMRALVVAEARPRGGAGLRWGLLAAAAALVLSLLWAALRTETEPTRAPDVAQHKPSSEGSPGESLSGPAAEAFTHIVVTTVGDDSTVLARYRVDESKLSQVARVDESKLTQVAHVDDTELIALLAQAGHQTGIIRMGEAVELTTPLIEPESGSAGAAE